MLESKGPMIRFSVIVACLLMLSLPLKLAYFQDDVTPEDEVNQRQALVDSIATHLAPLGFTKTLSQDDPFLPTVVLRNGDCNLVITPLPILKDLDDSFAFENAGFDGSLSYYFDGDYFDIPPINASRFWEYAARSLSTIGIRVRDRLRLGIAYSDECDLQGLLLNQMDLG